MADLVDGLAKIAVALPEETIAREGLFLDELLRWNEKINLTSIRNYSEAIEKHLLDSLVLLKYLPEKTNLLDMGSGGGLPGIPLAIARPTLEIVSVDSVGKKINFQKHIKRLLKLNNFEPRHLRLENLRAAETYEYITARALSDLSMLIGWAAPLQNKAGLLLVMKGPEGLVELRSAKNYFNDLYEVSAVDEYQLPYSHSERLVISLRRTEKILCNK